MAATSLGTSGTAVPSGGRISNFMDAAKRVRPQMGKGQANQQPVANTADTVSRIGSFFNAIN